MISRLRRKLLKSSAMVLVLPVCTFVSNAHSSRDNPFWPLIDVLRSIGKPVCAEAAGSLSDKNAADKNYSLHLRNAGLNSEDAGQIGQSMREVHARHDIRLDSFSASYNEGLGKKGVAHLLTNLPDHVGELGLVGCNLDDASASLIVDFMSRSQSLRMVCVEDNNFSASAKADITKVGAKLDGCVTIV